MIFLRTQLSAAIAWAMIPLAAWAGLPSTACVCANGHVKLFCQHALVQKHPSTAESCSKNCCGHEAVGLENDHDADCCGGGFCCHGTKSENPGIASKACCKPILSAPSVAPQSVSLHCDQAQAVVAVVQEIGALVHPSFIADLAEINTGPPLDRVIVFRSLLI
ncbi:MAG TPA: hypothetical protein VFI31_04825 [Pirellulales bacterium]|nr:hypothetical protein [Pirellulales bacterium]